MKKFKRLFLLLFFTALLRADVYILTRHGDVFRSDDGGINFGLVSNIGHPDGVSMYFNNDTLGLLLTESGIILKTTDRGVTWKAINALPTSDAKSIIATGNRYYVITRSGDLYMGYEPDSMTLLSSIGANDIVDITGIARELYALTGSGDIYYSDDRGRTWILKGNTGSMDMKALVMFPDTLFSINNTGDLFRSLDSGKTWIGISTISQIGVVDMISDENHHLYMVTDAGDVARSSTGSSWWFSGTVSQVGVVAIGMPTQPPLPADEDRNKRLPFRIYPTLTSDYFVLEADPTLLNKHLALFDLAGNRVMQGTIKSTKMTFNLRHYRAGIYFIEIENYSRKIIKP